MGRATLLLVVLAAACVGAQDYTPAPPVAVAKPPPPKAVVNVTVDPVANVTVDDPSPPPVVVAKSPPPAVVVAAPPTLVLNITTLPNASVVLPKTGRNINTWLKTSPLLSTSFSVAIAGGINGLMSNNEYIGTCFFPTDAAWTKFLAAAGLTKAQLLDNGPLVQKLARAMVVPHVALRTIDFEAGAKLVTLNQDALTMRPTSDVFVVVAGRSSAIVVIPDLVANDAIVQIIDTVLIPKAVKITTP